MGRGSKNLSKGNRKLALMHESESLHYRMYKAGRTWLFAGIATFSLGAVLLGTQVQAAAATAEDTTPTAQQQPATAPAATPAAKTTVDPTATAEAGAITKTSATSDQKPLTLDQSQKGNQEGLTAATTDAKGNTTVAKTAGALVSNLFGDGVKTAAENSPTAGLDAEGKNAVDSINTANTTQDRGNEWLKDASDTSKTYNIPHTTNGAIDKSATGDFKS